MRQFILLMLLCSISNSIFGQYKFFTDEANLSGQRILETNDGGYLISAVESCYTPGSVVIEGCIYAIHLVRTDSEGDTLWTNRISYSTQYGPGIKLFENQNGSFTIVAITNQTYICDGIGVTLSGFKQIEIFNIDINGSLISETKFPDECELTLIDVIKTGNNQFAVLTYFDRPPFSSDPEGRLFMMDNNGIISNQVVFPNETFKGGNLIQKNPNEFMVLYIQEDDVLKLKTYDLQLNVINEASNPDITNSCLNEYYIRNDSKLLLNNELGVLCEAVTEDYENVQIFRFDLSLNLLAEHKYTLADPTNFIEDDNENLIIASTNGTMNEGKNAKITYFSSMADSLYSDIISYDEADERPQHIINTSGNGFALVGSVNCCNYEPTVGPAKSFLLAETQLGSTEIDTHPVVTVSPNPANNYITVSREGDIISGNGVLDIFNALGEIVLRKEIMNRRAQISIGNLPNGIYFYSILLDNKAVSNGKLVKCGD